MSSHTATRSLLCGGGAGIGVSTRTFTQAGRQAATPSAHQLFSAIVTLSFAVLAGCSVGFSGGLGDDDGLNCNKWYHFPPLPSLVCPPTFRVLLGHRFINY